MKAIRDYQELKDTFLIHTREKLPSDVEEKIKRNIFEIYERLSQKLSSSELLEKCEELVDQWQREHSENYRFGRTDEASKSLLKLVTMELILSRPKDLI